ncbi:MAG: hypothetical protein M1823_005768 [Watsoniomyces obsoletus]|nr:MAG: hypothetical protein M1823_005768 [Watsoniomyces obsoletus]
MASSEGTSLPGPEHPTEMLLRQFRQASETGQTGVESSSQSPAAFAQRPSQTMPLRTNSVLENQRATSLPFGPQVATAPRRAESLTGVHQATASSPIRSPGPQGPQPHSASAVISPHVMTPTTASPAPRGRQGSSDRTSNLLNLLKFGQPAASTPPVTTNDTPGSTQAQTNHGQDVASRSTDARSSDTAKTPGSTASAADLVASLLGKPGTSGARGGSAGTPTEPSKPDVPKHELGKTPDQTQQMLLKLLHQRTPSGAQPADTPTWSAKGLDEEMMRSLSQKLAGTALEQEKNPGHHGKSADTPRGPSAARDSMAQASGSQERHRAPSSNFTYSHPLESSSSRRQTPRPGSSGRSATPKFNILKRPDATFTAETVQGEAVKRKSKEPSPEPEHVSSKRKLALSGEQRASTRSSPLASPSLNGHGRVETLRRTDSPLASTETVSKTLDEVGARISREVEERLEKVSFKQEGSSGAGEHEHTANEARLREPQPANGNSAQQPRSNPGDAQRTNGPAATEGLADSWESGEGEESGHGGVKDNEPRAIYVYNFPMRPFVALTLLASKRVLPSFAPDQIMEIARLKKEFDQTDRTLVTASRDFILYAMVKHGGMRVIRQDNGHDKQLYANLDDRIFNIVSVNGPQGSASGQGTAVFGTGVSGTVYWVNLTGPDGLSWEEEDAPWSGLIFPPMPSNDDGTSTGQVKTRAKKSSRHPQFFAIGRGKNIHIIWPEAAKHPRYLHNRDEGIVDMDKYTREHCVRIDAGKAAKDFNFSEDDTTIVTLDKAGRMCVWDMRRLVDAADQGTQMLGPSKAPAMEIKTPMRTYTTILSDDKARPSSVLFVDKQRPYVKGVAQRYLLVGLKQNHTLQLWDLMLGRPVQEVHFPHDQDSDAICSVAFHPTSGIIIVGHPTRNTIYFLTLSSPKYTLPAMTQSLFFQRVVQNDPVVSKPDATAIITGVREFSFGSKGQLRSLDVLQVPGSPSADPENPVLFELYAMHSRGISCISVRASDMGWTKEGRILQAADAVAEGVVEMDPLGSSATAAGAMAEDAGSEGDEPGEAKVTSTKKAGGVVAPRKELVVPKPSTPARLPSHDQKVGNGTGEAGSTVGEKSERKKKRQQRGGVVEVLSRPKDPVASSDATPAPAATGAGLPAKSPEALLTSNREENGSKPVDQPTTSPTKLQTPAPVYADVSSINLGVSPDFMHKEIKKIEKAVSTEFNRVFGQEFDKLFDRISQDQRIQNVAFDVKMETVLRMISPTLADNVEKTLTRVVKEGMQQYVLPAVKGIVDEAVERNVAWAIKERIRHVLQPELNKALRGPINDALQNPETMRMMAELVTDRISTGLENEVTAAVAAVMTPMMRKFGQETAHSMAVDVERRMADQLERLNERMRQQAEVDHRRMADLQDLVHGLTRTLTRMADVQTGFQQEILQLQQQNQEKIDRMFEQAQLGRLQHQGQAMTEQEGRNQESTVGGYDGPPGEGSSSSQRQQQHAQPSEAQQLQSDVVMISNLLKEGQTEAATIKWLQSPFQEDIFSRVLVRAGSFMVRNLTPLVLLSVAAAVASDLQSGNTMMDRLTWLEACLRRMNPTHPEIQPHVPRIMAVILERLSELGMALSNDNIAQSQSQAQQARDNDPIYQRVVQLMRECRVLGEQATAIGGGVGQ